MGIFSHDEVMVRKLQDNPRLSTLFAVTKAMGLTLTVEDSRAVHN